MHQPSGRLPFQAVQSQHRQQRIHHQVVAILRRKIPERTQHQSSASQGNHT